MQVREILRTYSDTAIDQLARDKIDESANLRLPRQIVEPEVAAALTSQTYVAAALAPSRPPTYAILKSILESEDQRAPIEAFREKVETLTAEMTERAAQIQGLSTHKNFRLYINILRNAWESGKDVDRSEAELLQALRHELGMNTREHLLLEHHPEVRPIWDVPGAYEVARNHLLLTGLVLTTDGFYIIADEVADQIRHTWGIELPQRAYHRLLESFRVDELYEFLHDAHLTVGGSKEEKISRLINAFVSPVELLESMRIEDLREHCKANEIAQYGRKDEIVTRIIDHFNALTALEDEAAEDEYAEPPAPEERELEEEVFSALLQYATNDQLYDILSACNEPTSGSKSTRIERIISTVWSETTILDHLRRTDLVQLCRKFGVPISGVKQELIERLLDEAGLRFHYLTSGNLTVDAGHEAANETKNEADSRSAEEAPNTSSEASSASSDSRELDTAPTVPENLEHSVQQQVVVAAVDPPGMRDIKIDFPYLDRDEQTVVCLIKEAKSLTDRDIKRVSTRHRLGWFLVRAHMADILFKMREAGNEAVRIRSSRSVNIYEWFEPQSGGASLSKRDARDVVDAIRQGVVPRQHLNDIIVGQEAQRRHLLELLDQAAQGSSAFKFVCGQYGAGKTFLCSWLREQALLNEFAVSGITLSFEQTMADLPVFYAGIINGLRTNEKRDACAIADIMESWLLKIHRRTIQVEGLSNRGGNLDDELIARTVEQAVDRALSNLGAHDPGMGPAMRAFYRARLSGDYEKADRAIAWISGSRALPAGDLREIGVRGHLEAGDVLPRLRAVLQMINGARYRGLAIIVDELDVIRKFQRTRTREMALEILRTLIDQSGANHLPSCLQVFVGTPEFFHDRRYGLPSDAALAERVGGQSDTGAYTSVRGPLIELHGLTSAMLMTAAKRVRNIHGRAYDWNAEDRLPDAAVNAFIRENTMHGGSAVAVKPRLILRDLIGILDVCEENPDVHYTTLLQFPVDAVATVPPALAPDEMVAADADITDRDTQQQSQTVEATDSAGEGVAGDLPTKSESVADVESELHSDATPSDSDDFAAQETPTNFTQVEQQHHRPDDLPENEYEAGVKQNVESTTDLLHQTNEDKNRSQPDDLKHSYKQEIHSNKRSEMGNVNDSSQVGGEAQGPEVGIQDEGARDLDLNFDSDPVATEQSGDEGGATIANPDNPEVSTDKSVDDDAWTDNMTNINDLLDSAF